MYFLLFSLMDLKINFSVLLTVASVIFYVPGGVSNNSCSCLVKTSIAVPTSIIISGLAPFITVSKFF